MAEMPRTKNTINEKAAGRYINITGQAPRRQQILGNPLPNIDGSDGEPDPDVAPQILVPVAYQSSTDDSMRSNTSMAVGTPQSTNDDASPLPAFVSASSGDESPLRSIPPPSESSSEYSDESESVDYDMCEQINCNKPVYSKNNKVCQMCKEHYLYYRDLRSALSRTTITGMKPSYDDESFLSFMNFAVHAKDVCGLDWGPIRCLKEWRVTTSNEVP